MSPAVSETTQLKIVQLLVTELGVKPQQVAAAVALLDEGATVAGPASPEPTGRVKLSR